MKFECLNPSKHFAGEGHLLSHKAGNGQQTGCLGCIWEVKTIEDLCNFAIYEKNPAHLKKTKNKQKTKKTTNDM